MSGEDAGAGTESAVDLPYDDPAWLRERIADVLEFYYPTCVDEERGGFVAQIDELSGDVYDFSSRHLVASSRFVVNFSLGRLLDGPDWCGPAAERGVSFLLDHHRDEERGGFHWLLDGTEPVDSRRVCYGHAFALLAFARATEAGVEAAPQALTATADLLTERFWEPEHDLFASEFDANWSETAAYRGQNANMHACEALLAAYEATGDERHLDRALAVARALTVRLARETDGLLWEHYTADWEHDFAYNRDRPRDLFRPWGYQPGHHAEWAKLLATLDRHADVDWLLDRAVELFDVAVGRGWDEENGGFYYTFDRDGEPVVDDKYGWPVAEAIGAAAALDERIGDERFRKWYVTFWEYAWDHLVAERGNWYERLTRENERIEPDEGPAVEPGYHSISACVEGVRSFGE